MLKEYLKASEKRIGDGLPPLPLSAAETKDLISVLERGDETHLNLFLNWVPGGASDAAGIKAEFLGKIATGSAALKGISKQEAVSLLYDMKGGKSVNVLIDLLNEADLRDQVVSALSGAVLVYGEFDRLSEMAASGDAGAKKILENWAEASWFTMRPALDAKIQATVFKVPDGTEASTDFLSHGKGGHTRTDTALHARDYFMDKGLLAELLKLKAKGKRIAFVSDVLGTGSSRKSAMNNIEYNVGIENEDTRHIPLKRAMTLVIGGKTVAPIFEKTAEDMGAVLLRADVSSLKTGDEITIDLKDGSIGTKDGKIPFGKINLDILQAGGGTLFRMGKILTEKARAALKGKTFPALPYRTPEIPKDIPDRMPLAYKIIAKAAGLKKVKEGMDVLVRVSSVASQDTTGPMTAFELKNTLACLKSAAPLLIQTQCHNAAMSFRTEEVVKTNQALVDSMKEAGAVTFKMGDGIIHSWLNELVLPQTVVTGGDSHTRCPTALAFPQGSGGVAEAIATGMMEIKVPKVVKVVLSGEYGPGITIRDLVNAVPYAAAKKFGSNVFEGAVIEFERAGSSLSIQDVFKLTNSSAERSASAALFANDAATVVAYLRESSIPLIQGLIKDGYDTDDSLKRRLKEMEDWVKSPALMTADPGAEYAGVLEINLGDIKEPLIACPDTPDNVKPLSELSGVKIDAGFVGSCMVSAVDFEKFLKVLSGSKPKEAYVAAPMKRVRESLDQAGVTKALTDLDVKFEVSGCSLCMGNQFRISGKKNIVSTSTRNFKNRMGDEGSIYLASPEIAGIALRLGRFPSVQEYQKMMKGI